MLKVILLAQYKTMLRNIFVRVRIIMQFVRERDRRGWLYFKTKYSCEHTAA